MDATSATYADPYGVGMKEGFSDVVSVVLQRCYPSLEPFFVAAAIASDWSPAGSAAMLRLTIARCVGYEFCPCVAPTALLGLVGRECCVIVAAQRTRAGVGYGAFMTLNG